MSADIIRRGGYHQVAIISLQEHLTGEEDNKEVGEFIDKMKTFVTKIRIIDQACDELLETIQKKEELAGRLEEKK